MYSRCKEVYDKTEYLPLVPSDSDEKRFVYKFNSVEHVLSYVQFLNANFKRGTTQDSSQKTNKDEHGWYASKSFEDAITRIRGVEFDSSGVAMLQQRIRAVRRASRFADDGYEIDIPEALAKSERYWLQSDSRRSISRIFDDTIFINASYNSMTDAEKARKAGLTLLEEIYKLGVIPRKIVCVFWADNVVGRENGMRGSVPIFIDVSFRDLNGIAKALHPAMFRRLVFRIKEIMSDLSFGYGSSQHSSTSRGFTEIANIIEGNAEGHVKKLLGLDKAAV